MSKFSNGFKTKSNSTPLWSCFAPKLDVNTTSPAANATPPIVVAVARVVEEVITLSSQVVLYAFKLAVNIFDLKVYPASKPNIFSFDAKGFNALVKFK